MERKRLVHSLKLKAFAAIVIIVTVAIAAMLGGATGYFVALIDNAERQDPALERSSLSLPSKLLARDGRLISEFFATEKRELIGIQEIPDTLVYALLAREDQSFYSHRGIDPKGLFRASLNIVLGRYFSGGSSITQQVAGALYADRFEITLRRKLKEAFHTFHLEKVLTKDEILEIYVNSVYFGHNTYGVEAASGFYFGHSARNLTPAEAALLVIQLASPGKYSPINEPNAAKKMQKEVLNQMVKLQFITRAEADASLHDYWAAYVPNRSGDSSAYIDRKDRARYFTEYTRRILEAAFFGQWNIYTDGLTIHSTLDLDHQQIADEMIQRGIEKIDTTFKDQRNIQTNSARKMFEPILSALSLAYSMPSLDITRDSVAAQANRLYNEVLFEPLNIIAILSGSDRLYRLTQASVREQEDSRRKSDVEGALVSIENGTGDVLAMVGGSDFQSKQFNRAVDSRVQPGSAFKPLYYSAAISSRLLTPSSVLYDSPSVFTNPDGTIYMPENYLGQWKGRVFLREALANSMNVPSIKVLDTIGFETAIDRAARLLGLDDNGLESRSFPRTYPLGLGIIAVAPIQMARAYSVFPNKGIEIVPRVIRYVEDRYGNIIYPEIEASANPSAKPDRIMDPQSAYIMVSLLESTVDEGTLKWRRIGVGGFDGMPMAGKTGTTQNWSDAWTVGFSPYITTAIWFGFDMPGNSLGRNQTGATVAGPVWAEYMKVIHQDLVPKSFDVPQQGLVFQEICTDSGRLPAQDCSETATEVYLSGTEPHEIDTYLADKNTRDAMFLEKLKDRLRLGSRTISSIDLTIPTRGDFRREKVESDSVGSEAEADIRDVTGNPLLD